MLAYILHAPAAAAVPSPLSLRAPAAAKTPFLPSPIRPPPPRRAAAFAPAGAAGPIAASLLEGPVLVWAGRLCLYYALLHAGLAGSPLNPFLSHEIGGEDGAGDSDLGFSKWAEKLRGGASAPSTSMAFHCATAIFSPCPQPCGLLRRQHHRHHALPRSAFRHPRNLTVGAPRICGAVCSARRLVRFEEGEDEEEYGHNEEIMRLERYSEGARNQAFLVKARVDNEVEVVLVFKGFSSSLSGRTAADPAMSVLPVRAIIQSVDVVKGPFDPNNIEYLEKDLAWDYFKSRLQ